MSTTSTKFAIPNLFAVCPIKGTTNPHYEKAAAESSAWVRSHNILSKIKLDGFAVNANELLASHTYPYAGYEEFRTCCDFLNLLFVVDEVSDEQNGSDAWSTGQVFLNAIRDPKWDDGSKLAKMCKEFRARFSRSAGPGCTKRFFENLQNYVEAVAQEAVYREHGHITDLATYEPLRRENSAIRTCMSLAEFALNIDLPDDIFKNEHFMDVYWATVDMVCWSNDLYSYDMEQAKGLAGNNYVTVLMHEQEVCLQTAFHLVGDQFKALMEQFMRGKRALPSLGFPADFTVSAYVMAMGYWVVGNLEWCFESQRYFGPRGAEIRKTLVIELSPPEH